MSDERAALAASLNDERRRELAIEHLLFGTIRYIEARHPGLIDELQSSLSHLGDKATGPDKNDEAVREVAERFLDSLRRAAT